MNLFLFLYYLVALLLDLKYDLMNLKKIKAKALDLISNVCLV